MDYHFVKEIYAPFLQNLRTDGAALEGFVSHRENGFILKHNLEALSQLLKFLESPDNIFILNGFMGSGKTSIVDSCLDFIAENVLVFKNSYQEAINLDDILLSIFKDFSVYHNEKKVTLPKVESNIFSEKINTYVKNCNVPMLFVFDSFDINLRAKDTQKDILDFINYLSHFEKIKVIICSRTFKPSDLLSSDSIQNCVIKSLTIEEMKTYLKENEINGNEYELSELYKVSRGHYLMTELSVLIMKILEVPLSVYTSEYKNTSKNFLDFIISKLLSVSSEKYTKLLALLSVLRHGVSGSFLVNQNIATLEDIDFLLKKHVISEKSGRFYLKDYIKNTCLKGINSSLRTEIHKYLIGVYEAELPLKPFDRGLFLSRLTMRQEIAYHTKKLQELETQTEASKHGDLSQTFQYITYSRSGGFKPKAENKDSNVLNASSSTDSLPSNPEKMKAEKPPLKQETNIKPTEFKPEIVPQSLDEYVEIAQHYEEAFNFSSAIVYYKKALTYKDDKMFKVKEPVIYTKLAICYKKIQDSDEAIRLYEKVYSLYIKEAPEKANEILLSIAQIYSELYKFDKAEEVYKRILNSPAGVSSEMKVRVYLDLSELEDNNLDIEAAVQYSRKALSEAEKLSDIPLLCECYFKYALMLDDRTNTALAVKYYLRCVQTSSDVNVNEYIASAYSNLAEISIDNKNISAAKKYYELSINADKQLNNNEGLYYSYTKLANLYKHDNLGKAHELLAGALGAAKGLEDMSYTISAYIEIGDFYAEQKQFKQALKSYILVRTLAPQHMAENLTAKLNGKINQIKVLLGDVEFLRLMNEIKKKK